MAAGIKISAARVSTKPYEIAARVAPLGAAAAVVALGACLHLGSTGTPLTLLATKDGSSTRPGGIPAQGRISRTGGVVAAAAVVEEASPGTGVGVGVGGAIGGMLTMWR